ncbi:MAG TPA: LysM peptidoglycan-binding domain-containing protein [Usitatibacter sp.]|nr:LysM peptidoglycan-binding domain-containing protein [Usitatibacter sp.]
MADGMPAQDGKGASQAGSADHVTQADLQPNAPTDYTVVKGDTLWGISARFLKDPWKWPQIWRLNREEIKNPHWIYPGDVIHLDRTAEGGPRLSLVGGGSDVAAANVVKLEPRVRVEPLQTAIPTIPGSAIGPFLSQPLVVEEGAMDNAPTIVATEEGRVMVSAGEIAYADRIAPADGVNWQVFRPGTALHDPETGELLGIEAQYLGDARVRRYGNPTTLQIIREAQEINRGDRLAPARESSFPSYVPHAPDKPIAGEIMSVEGGVAEIGQFQIVTINRGSRDGLEVGHVLASYHRGALIGHNGHDTGPIFDTGWMKGIDVKPVPVVPEPPVPSPDQQKPGAVLSTSSEIKLPDERNGIVFVFRVFEKMSYAIVMRATKPIYVGDVVRTP